MNKTTLGLLIALLASVGIWYYLESKEVASTSTPPDRLFRVEDENSIGRFFIADMKGRTMNLTRDTRGEWLINDSLVASPTIMDQVVNVFGKMRIDYIPPKAMVPQILESMRTNAIKVEVYDRQNEKLRSILIGPSSQDERNSFIMVEGQKQPYAIKIPGLTGPIRPLFDLRSVGAWQSLDFVEYDPEQIKSIEVRYPRQAGESFKIERVEADTLRLSPLSELVEITNVDINQRLLQSYLEGYSYVPRFERWEDHPKRDSIVSTIPFAQIRIEEVNGEVTILELNPAYPVDNETNRVQTDQNFTNYFVERGSEELVTVQVAQLGQWLKSYSSFYKQ